jgi:capsule polysaccharide export protein KpsE/RkpR
MADADELATLRRKLATRERMNGGYGPNIEALKARIAELEAEQEPPSE